MTGHKDSPEKLTLLLEEDVSVFFMYFLLDSGSNMNKMSPLSVLDESRNPGD